MAYIGAGITRFNTADQLTVTGDATIDTTTLVVDSTNNRVGIGTSSPTSTASAGPTLEISGTAGGNLVLSDSNATTGQRAKYFLSQGGALYIGHSADNGTSPVNDLAIDGSGNVGIGTISPSTYGGKLNITDGAAGGETTLVVANNNANQFIRVGINANVAQIAYDDADSLAFGIATDSTTSGLTTEHMRITSGGNVGIGTSSPLQDLHISSTSGTKAIFERTGSTGAFIGLKDSSGSFVYLGDNNGTFEVQTAGSSYSTKLAVTSAGNVGIGTSSPSSYYANQLVVDTGSAVQSGITIVSDTGNQSMFAFADGTSGDQRYRGFLDYNHSNDVLSFGTAGGERMRIDSSGNLLVGKTSAGIGNVGFEFNPSGYMFATRSGGYTANFNRQTSDGDIAVFSKDDSAVGSIAAIGGDLIIFSTATGHSGLRFASTYVGPTDNSGTSVDNTFDMGVGAYRWDDIYATNGTIQTSDRNEKQQIASLTNAEMQAAKAISKLFKTFKWNDSVAEKSDAARTHTGVIAQEVEQAMTDAGLNAGDYAFFISSDWTDEETGEERNRKGIRYPQLMSFIGAATEQRLASIEARLDALEGA